VRDRTESGHPATCPFERFVLHVDCETDDGQGACMSTRMLNAVMR
jgi:hypothetical protein